MNLWCRTLLTASLVLLQLVAAPPPRSILFPFGALEPNENGGLTLHTGLGTSKDGIGGDLVFGPPENPGISSSAGVKGAGGSYGIGSGLNWANGLKWGSGIQAGEDKHRIVKRQTKVGQAESSGFPNFGPFEIGTGGSFGGSGLSLGSGVNIFGNSYGLGSSFDWSNGLNWHSGIGAGKPPVKPVAAVEPSSDTMQPKAVKVDAAEISGSSDAVADEKPSSVAVEKSSSVAEEKSSSVAEEKSGSTGSGAEKEAGSPDASLTPKIPSDDQTA